MLNTTSKIRAGDNLLFRRDLGDKVAFILNSALKLKYPEYRRLLKTLPFEVWHAAPVLSVNPEVSVLVMEAQKEGNRPKEYKWQYILGNCIVFLLTNNEPPEEKVELWVDKYTGTSYDFGAYLTTVVMDILGRKGRWVDNQYHCWELTCRFDKDVLHVDVQPEYEVRLISKMLKYFIGHQIGG